VLKGTPLVLLGRRHDKFGWGEVVSVLKQRCGLKKPPPRTLKQQIEAQGLVPAPEVGGPPRGGDPEPAPVDMTAEAAAALSILAEQEAAA
jgi:hypothetical protein